MMELKKLGLLVGILLLFSIFFIVTAQPSEAAVEDTRIDPSIDGPEEFFVNKTVSYEVEIRGAFRVGDRTIRTNQADNWTLRTESTLEATIDPDESDSSSSNIFTVNVTVHEEGEGTLNFRAYCRKDGEVAFNEKQFQISVEKPERTSVTIENPTDAHIEELEVALYINGELKDTQTLRDLEPGEERRVTFEWSKRGLDSGEHTLEVRTEDRLVMSRTFQIEEETSSWIYAGVILAVIAASVLIFIWYKNRRRRQRRPW